MKTPIFFTLVSPRIPNMYHFVVLYHILSRYVGDTLYVALDYVKPVSYTHLDVYKRQGYIVFTLRTSVEALLNSYENSKR